MTDFTLLIFEGEKTEPKLFVNINKTFFQGERNPRVCAPIKHDIYGLWNILKKDRDLDVFEVVKERNRDNPAICALERHRVSQIFLFFDYDGHAPTSSDDNLDEMIQFFDEETEHGKLYVSYPMVESIKDYDPARPGFFQRAIVAKINKGYKRIVHKRSGYRDTDKIQFPDWKVLIEHGLKRTRCLLFNVYEYPSPTEYAQMTQERILKEQRSKHIDPNRTVAIISGLPLFIVDYFGYRQLTDLLALPQK